MDRYTSIILIVCITSLPAVAIAQGMCVLDPVEVDHLEGAVLFEVGDKSTTLPDVTVSMCPYAGRDFPPVGSVVSKSDGGFSIKDAAPGQYWLSFRHKALIGFSVEVHLRPRSRSRTTFLIATIRNDPNKPCGGGSVRSSPVVEV